MCPIRRGTARHSTGPASSRSWRRNGAVRVGFDGPHSPFASLIEYGLALDIALPKITARGVMGPSSRGLFWRRVEWVEAGLATKAPSAVGERLRASEAVR